MWPNSRFLLRQEGTDLSAELAIDPGVTVWRHPDTIYPAYKNHLLTMNNCQKKPHADVVIETVTVFILTQPRL